LANIANLNSIKSQPHQDAATHMKVIETGDRADRTKQKQNWAKERNNIASFVHDEICPKLIFLLHDMYWIEKSSKCSKVKTRANHCIDQLTNTMSTCKTVLLSLRNHDEGPSLTDSLNAMISNFKVNFEIAVEAEIDIGINQLGIEEQSLVYRSIQEALSNVRKHAHAKHVNITAKKMLHHIHVQVVDDGVGLGQDPMTPSFCLGLKLQKSRTEELGGHFLVQNNSNGKGTQFHLTFPLPLTQ
jgi:signal transduction histidine kinase